MLVTQQGEVLVQIEQDAEATAGHLKEGNRFVDRAIKSARSTRAVRFSLAFFSFLISFVSGYC